MAERYSTTAVVIERFNAKTYCFEEVERHRDATLRQLDGGNPSHPDHYFELRIARDADPETGTTLNSDGERSIDYRTMAGATIRVGSDAMIIVTGFCQDREHMMPPPDVWHREQWHQWTWDDEVDKWFAERDETNKANH